MPEREAEGASGAAGWRGLGSTPEPSPNLGDFAVAIGVFYALAMIPITLFFTATGIPELILESHLGPLLLPRVGWTGWPWFLAPYAIPGLVLACAGRRRLPVVCGLALAVWLVEGALLALFWVAMGV